MNLIEALARARKVDGTAYVKCAENGKDYLITAYPPPDDYKYHYFRVGRYGVEWVKGEEPESAKTHYSGLWLEMLEIERQISKARCAHKKRFDGADYGYPGDLGAVNEKLREVLEQLGG